MRLHRLLPIALLTCSASLSAQAKPRENDLKLPIGGVPGALDAITDVAGVEVGHTTLISGSGALVVGRGPVRTGVTVIHPRGKGNSDPVFAAWFTLNGNGEMTGTTWVQESGYLDAQRGRRPRRDHQVGSLAEEPPATVVAARGCRDVRRRVERHQRLSCEGGSRDHRAQLRDGWAPGRRRRGRRHGDDVPRLQGRDRDSLSETAGAAGRLYRWCPRAMQFRIAARPPDRWRACGRGDHRPHGMHRQLRSAPGEFTAPPL